MANSYIIHKVEGRKFIDAGQDYIFFRERRKKVSEYTSRIHSIVFYGKNDKKKMFSAKEEIFKSHKIIQKIWGKSHCLYH